MTSNYENLITPKDKLNYLLWIHNLATYVYALPLLMEIRKLFWWKSICWYTDPLNTLDTFMLTRQAIWYVLNMFLYGKILWYKTRTQAQIYLIRLQFNPKCFEQNYSIFRPMLTAEYVVYLWMYIHINCTYEHNTANDLNIDQQLLGFTLRVNP